MKVRKWTKIMLNVIFSHQMSTSIWIAPNNHTHKHKHKIKSKMDYSKIWLSRVPSRRRRLRRRLCWHHFSTRGRFIERSLSRVPHLRSDSVAIRCDVDAWLIIIRIQYNTHEPVRTIMFTLIILIYAWARARLRPHQSRRPTLFLSPSLRLSVPL